jgi:hypothetical protein
MLGVNFNLTLVPFLLQLGQGASQIFPSRDNEEARTNQGGFGGIPPYPPVLAGTFGRTLGQLLPVLNKVYLGRHETQKKRGT